MFSVLLISRATIMNDASRKNMMSISGMMTIRERRFGMGDGIFIELFQPRRDTDGHGLVPR